MMTLRERWVLQSGQLRAAEAEASALRAVNEELLRRAAAAEAERDELRIMVVLAAHA